VNIWSEISGQTHFIAWNRLKISSLELILLSDPDSQFTLRVTKLCWLLGLSDAHAGSVCSKSILLANGLDGMYSVASVCVGNKRQDSNSSRGKSVQPSATRATTILRE
jgi:hypothetical protein